MNILEMIIKGLIQSFLRGISIMDYSYLKIEIENEKKLNYKKLVDAYEQQERQLINILSEHIKGQVEEAVKNCYKFPSEKERQIRLGRIKKPTLFRRYYVYEDESEDVIIVHSNDWSGPFENLYSKIYDWDVYVPCVNIPENKLNRFWNLLNQQLLKYSIRTELKQKERWYSIIIIADIGKL